MLRQPSVQSLVDIVLQSAISTVMFTQHAISTLQTMALCTSRFWTFDHAQDGASGMAATCSGLDDTRMAEEQDESAAAAEGEEEVEVGVPTAEDSAMSTEIGMGQAHEVVGGSEHCKAERDERQAQEAPEITHESSMEDVSAAAAPVTPTRSPGNASPLSASSAPAVIMERVAEAAANGLLGMPEAMLSAPGPLPDFSEQINTMPAQQKQLDPLPATSQASSAAEPSNYHHSWMVSMPSYPSPTPNKVLTHAHRQSGASLSASAANTPGSAYQQQQDKQVAGPQRRVSQDSVAAMVARFQQAGQGGIYPPKPCLPVGYSESTPSIMCKPAARTGISGATNRIVSMRAAYERKDGSRATSPSPLGEQNQH